MEQTYKHKVKYYETDAMAITHHSNYVRWMEEARCEMMDNFGYSFKRLESEGISSPVLSYSCEIKNSTKFDDIVEIIPKVVEYNGVRLKVHYEIKLEEKIIATGETSHCFTNTNGLPVRLNKACSELDNLLKLELLK